MDDFETHPQSASVGTGGQTTALFLALYLLVLAFFIILVTISSLEEVKSKAVMDSLSSTFASVLQPTTDTTAFIARDGNILAGEAFQEEISGVFSTAIQVTKVEIVHPGQSMQVTLLSDSLFFPDSTRIREAQIALIDRLVAALSASPPGLSHELEFMIGSSTALGDSFPIGETLEMARAGSFARTMRSRGVSPHSLSIGLRADDPDKIVMRFFTRALDEEALKFDEAANSRAQEGNGT